VGTGFTLYGRARLDRAFEFVSELMKRTTQRSWSGGRWASLSNDKTGCIDIRIRQTERRDNAIAASFGRAKMDKQNLVFVVINNAVKFRAAPDQVARRELAFEHGVL
jgi:hypothetical protein